MKITAQEFEDRTKIDPNWCAEITEPIEVTDYLHMRNSNIKSLSPLLTFTGRDTEGQVADFRDCKDLVIAQGKFHGFVSFTDSGIKKIQDLEVIQPDLEGKAASFMGCEHLKIATGKYNGYVCFAHSEIEKLENLIITQTDPHGDCLSCDHCEHLTEVKGTFPGYVDLTNSNVQETKGLVITGTGEQNYSVNFTGCKNLKIIRGQYKGKILAEEELIKAYQQYLNTQKLRKRKNEEPTLEL